MFAILQKSTGYFMPQFGKNQSKGGTWLEPAPNVVPRLFRRRQDAKVALDQWLKGRLIAHRPWQVGPDDDPDTWLEREHVSSRNADDMEIVEVDVVVRSRCPEFI